MSQRVLLSLKYFSFMKKKKKKGQLLKYCYIFNVCMMVEGHLKEEVKNKWCVICVLSNRTALEASLNLYKLKISYSLFSVLSEYKCVSTDMQRQNILLMTLENQG